MVSRTLVCEGELVRALSRALKAASETAYVKAISPSTSHHRKVDAVAALELVVTVDRDAAQVEAEPRRLALEQRERRARRARSRSPRRARPRRG